MDDGFFLGYLLGRSERSKNNGPGCLIFLIIFIALFFTVGHVSKVSETKEREERTEQIFESIENEGIYYQQEEDHMVVVGLADINLTSIAIPEEINGIPVTTITDRAFAEEKITKVVLPASIQTLGRSCFSSCRELKSINIPRGVCEIPDNCFGLCQNLQEVSIPETVEVIGSGAFYYTAISSVDLSNVNTIESFAFSRCIKLTSITFSSQLTTLEKETFSSCLALRSIELPDGITSIGKECFAFCSSLTDISLPDSLTDIGSRCFSYCSQLPSIRIPPNVKKLDGYMFYQDSNLKSVTVPRSCSIPNGKEPFELCEARVVFY